jgi:hypothetical protein
MPGHKAKLLAFFTVIDEVKTEIILLIVQFRYTLDKKLLIKLKL